METKKCIRCEEIKTVDNFSISKQGYYHSYCRSCSSILFKQYREKNKDKLREKQKEYQEKNKEVLLKKWSKYHLKNKEKRNRQTKEYFQTEKGKCVCKNGNQNRRKHINNSDVTTSQLLELNKNAKVCYWCNKSLKGKKIHIDHYIPLSKGGKHTISNLVVSCSSCNLSKHTKDPIVFANSLGKLL